MSVWESVADRRSLTWTALAAAVPLVCLAAAYPAVQGVCLTALLFPALVAYSRFRVEGLIIAFLISQSLVHMVKRAIFLFGPQPQAVYFGIQLLPTVVLGILMVVVVRQLRGRRLPLSARLLAAYLALAAATTLASVGRLPWLEVLTAMHQQLPGFLLFFAGLLLTPEKLARVGRTMGILAAVSVLYGFLQLAGGPTILDRAWANETYAYSLHGRKVFAYLEGATPQFRSYSYYADPLTWGLFLLAGIAGAVIARRLGRMSRVVMVGVILLALAGLFFCLTRTVWAGLLAMLGAFWLLRFRCFRRPWLVFGLVLSCFAATVGVGDLLYRELFLARRLPMFQSPIAARYLTVGTIEARISAWAALREVSLAHPLWGEGYAIMFSANRGAMDPSAYRPPISHNFLVELAFDVGVPGTLLFLWFVFQWLKEGLTLLGRTADRRVRFATRFVIAWAIGQVITGYLNGPSFMTSEFFLIAGAASGFQARASSFAFNRKKINQLCHASVSDPACCLGSQAANF